MTMNARDDRRSIRRLSLIGFATLVLLFGGIGGWAATSQLTGAVIAAGLLVVDTNVKKVQHPVGGVVGQIMVTEGSQVEAGQIVIRLDDTQVRATLGIVRSQLDELMARQARLRAERDDSDSITFPQQLLARQDESAVETAISGERNLFDSRRSARTGQRSQLREQVAQTNEEIRGLEAQQLSKEQEIKFIAEEFTGVENLYRQNLVTIVRFMQLQRDRSRLEGDRGKLVADVARARGKISETELKIIQIDQDFRSEVLKDLRDSEGKIAELSEKKVGSEDLLRRIDIRAPQTGIVNQLAVHTIGGVIGPGETIMQIVPLNDKLVVEAKVAPHDIDQLSIGAAATVRIMAGNQRTSPVINGELIRISADVMREQQSNQSNQRNQDTQSNETGQAYYIVRVSLPEDRVQQLKELKLVPGMPAEVFIQTYARTPLEFLVKPLREQIARTFRER